MKMEKGVIYTKFVNLLIKFQLTIQIKKRYFIENWILAQFKARIPTKKGRVKSDNQQINCNVEC